MNNRLGSHSAWLIQIKDKKRLKEKSVHKTVAEKLKTESSARSIAFHTVRESEGSEHRTRLEHDIELIKWLIDQLILQDISGITETEPSQDFKSSIKISKWKAFNRTKWT